MLKRGGDAMNQRTKEELSPNMKRRFLKEWNETIFTLFWKIFLTATAL